MTELQTLMVLTFDEIYISNKTYIDRTIQKKLGSHRSCQTAAARGLVGQWKEPIYYQFDHNMTKVIMFEIIAALYSAGLIVVVITSDMGTGNMGLCS